MPNNPDFPHLNLSFQGTFEPKFQGGRKGNAEVKANRNDPVAHTAKLRGVLDGMRRWCDDVQRVRVENGLPPIPPDKGFLLRLPEGVDVEQIISALGVELVAETEEGLMLVSSESLELSKLEEVLQKFSTGTGGKVAGSSLLDIYDKPDDPRRLKNILSEDIFNLWPFENDKVYIFDFGIQTAASSHTVDWPRVIQRRNETGEEFQKRREEKRREAWVIADTEWQDRAETRVNEIRDFIAHYDGEILSGIISANSEETEGGIVFPDSVQVRIRIRGDGLRDVVLNFAHLFEVSVPPDIQIAHTEECPQTPLSEPNLITPSLDAPSVCIIDSGIEEGHKWLANAIDSEMSRCFLPGVNTDDVADYVKSQGHGTRVAGAVLYPFEIPTEGEVNPVAWIQNARVLNAANELPDNLSPEEYLREVVAHFHVAPRYTKIFNHSINGRVPCPKQRMTAWAAKIDQLSHEQEVLFIQSAGNQDRKHGDQANPGLCNHLENGLEPPHHQLEASMRIANPAQSLHALTVGSISGAAFEDADTKSFAGGIHEPSGFSRSGYGEPWSVVKPEVVELGGDYVYSKNQPRLVKPHAHLSVELLNSTMHGSPAHSKDGNGTSFAAPKVAHVAAHLQRLFPTASPLLYRALIVQSARWPEWAEKDANKDKVLRLIGYGLPSLERATRNSERRITLITADAETLPSKQLHLYTVRIPEELRSAALEAKIRVDVTLAYTALPRRTRARRTGYLETWLDWEASRLGEPRDEFLKRMQEGGRSNHDEFPWTLHKRNNSGEAEETNRNRGSLQKDWAVFDSFNLPSEFAIAVRSHIGWNHLAGAGTARYCLVVTFEVLQGEVPIYSLIESQIEIETENRVMV